MWQHVWISLDELHACIKIEKNRYCKIRISGRVFENTNYFPPAYDVPATLWTDSSDDLIKPCLVYKYETRQNDWGLRSLNRQWRERETDVCKRLKTNVKVKVKVPRNRPAGPEGVEV
jgi:hypothetical protein